MTMHKVKFGVEVTLGSSGQAMYSVQKNGYPMSIYVTDMKTASAVVELLQKEYVAGFCDGNKDTLNSMTMREPTEAEVNQYLAARGKVTADPADLPPAIPSWLDDGDDIITPDVHAEDFLNPITNTSDEFITRLRLYFTRVNNFNMHETETWMDMVFANAPYHIRNDVAESMNNNKVYLDKLIRASMTGDNVPEQNNQGDASHALLFVTPDDLKGDISDAVRNRLVLYFSMVEGLDSFVTNSWVSLFVDGRVSPRMLEKYSCVLNENAVVLDTMVSDLDADEIVENTSITHLVPVDLLFNVTNDVKKRLKVYLVNVKKMDDFESNTWINLVDGGNVSLDIRKELVDGMNKHKEYIDKVLGVREETHDTPDGEVLVRNDGTNIIMEKEKPYTLGDIIRENLEDKEREKKVEEMVSEGFDAFGAALIHNDGTQCTREELTQEILDDFDRDEEAKKRFDAISDVIIRKREEEAREAKLAKHCDDLNWAYAQNYDVPPVTAPHCGGKPRCGDYDGAGDEIEADPVKHDGDGIDKPCEEYYTPDDSFLKDIVPDTGDRVRVFEIDVVVLDMVKTYMKDGWMPVGETYLNGKDGMMGIRVQNMEREISV